MFQADYYLKDRTDGCPRGALGDFGGFFLGKGGGGRGGRVRGGGFGGFWHFGVLGGVP